MSNPTTAAEMPALAPCPFCGGEAELWRAHAGRTAWVACMGRCAVLVTKEHLTDAEAIAAWNRRALPSDDEMVERVARALCQNALAGKKCPCAESGVFRCGDSYPGLQARAALAAMRGE